MTTILSVSGLFSFVSSSSVFADSLTLTIPSSPLSLDLNPSVNNGFAATSGSFNVKTDNNAGYTTSIKTKNESGDNSLINGNNKLTSISGPISEDTFKNGSEYLNMWGWLPNKLNSEDNTSYQIAPGTEEVVLDKTEEVSSDTGTDYNISLAAKVANDTPTGKYENTFVVSAVSNELPLDGIMQNWNGCDTLGIYETVTLMDIRDGNTYTVSKFKDNRCWMTQNLRLGDDKLTAKNPERKLTPEDSDIYEDFILPEPESSDNIDYVDGPVIYTIKEDSNKEREEYGGYYNRKAATADPSTGYRSGTNLTSSSSICPKGWELPTAGTIYNGGDIRKMVMSEGFDIKDYDNKGASTLFQSSPFGFSLGGYFSTYGGDEGLKDRESGGYYHSSVYAGWEGGEDDYTYIFSITSTGIGPSDIQPGFGLSIRCVSKEEEKTMQSVDDWESSIDQHDIIKVTDSRDNNKYAVSRLDDGKLWMIENLRTQGITLTPDDSSVKDNYELKPSPTLGFDGYVNVNESYFYGGSFYSADVASAGKNYGEQYSICPKGWHLPTVDEYNTLLAAYGNQPSNLGKSYDYDNIGPKLVRNGYPSDLSTTGLKDPYSTARYLTSTYACSDEMSLVFVMEFKSSSFSPINLNNWGNNFAGHVRCVAGEWVRDVKNEERGCGGTTPMA